MSKVITINYENCVGCKTCMQACSLKHGGVVNPLLSRIEIIRVEMGIENVPLVCAQCESAPCAAICPVKAISRDNSLDRMMIDYDKCIGCRMCVAVCPFGCMSFDSVNKMVFHCDLCDGDPICVRFCQHDTLQYVDASELSHIKCTAIGEKLSAITHSIAEAMPNDSGR